LFTINIIDPLKRLHTDDNTCYLFTYTDYT